jgi:beta-lactamase class A
VKHPDESSVKKVNKKVNKKLLIWVFILALLCLGFILLPEASSVSSDGLTLDIQDLRKRLEREIKESGAEVGLAFKDLESGESLLIRADMMMHAASLMKVPVMIEVFRQAEQGKFQLDEKILVKNEFKSIVDGSPYSLTVTDDSDDDIYQYIGKKLSIKELVHRMITVSSNLATNVLIELVDAPNVMRTLDELGIHNMKVLRGVEDIKAYEKGLNNQTDALSMMQVLLSILEGAAGSEEACQQMIEILSQQKFRAKIPAGIPEGIRVGNKTGSITRIDHDAAIVFPEERKPYVLVVLTRGIENREDAEGLIAGLSKVIYQEVVGAPFDIK